MMRKTLVLLAALAAPATAKKPPGPPAPPVPPPVTEPVPPDSQLGRRLQEVLRAHGGDVHGCYGVALAERPGLRGEVLLRMWVQPGGTVARVDALKDSVDSGRLTSCITEALRHWKVPELAGGDTAQIVFPLAFRPDGATAIARVVVPLADGKPGPLPGGRLEARVLVEPNTVGPTKLSLTRLTLKPSARLALHRHPGALELLYVVKGRAHVRNAFTPAAEAAETGDVIAILPDAPHSIEAAPLAPLELVQIFAPAGPEQAYLDPRARGQGTLPAQKQKGAAAEPPDPKLLPTVVKASTLKPYPILAGKGAAYLFLDGYANQGAALERIEVELAGLVPEHRHDTSDEVIYVVSGKGEMTVGGKPLTVGAGDAIHVPLGVPHSLVVTERMVAVQSYGPAGPEQRFKAAPARPPADGPAGGVPGPPAPGATRDHPREGPSR